MARAKHKHKKERRPIYILPNLFTTLSLFFGFYSILCSVGGRFSIAAWSILVSALCDGLDGTVARMTGTTSKFGVEYDSLCDLVAFGAAPSLMVYFWALTPSQLQILVPYSLHLGAAVAFVFLACGALRLARFNVFSGVRDPGFFQGLPIPGGALILAAAVLWHYRLGPEPIAPNGLLILTLTTCLAVLMVSDMDYISHKNRAIFRSRRPFETLAVLVVVLTLVIIRVKSALLPLGFLYLISGPVVTLTRRRKKTLRTQPAETRTEEESKVRPSERL